MTIISRRSFIKTTGMLAMLGAVPQSVLAAAELAAPARRLRVAYRTLEINKRSAKVYGLLDDQGRSGLTFNKGDIFNVVLANETDEATLIHWHGLTPPWEMDGVPDVTQPLLKPNSVYSYNFPLNAAGTNWMHAHTLQEQNLLAAPLIIRNDPSPDEQEIVVLLHDFSFKTPEELLAYLKGGMAHGGGHDMASMHHDMAGMSANEHEAMMKEIMDMDMEIGMNMGAGGQSGGMDVNDLEYDAYLANDRTLDDPEVFKVEAGGRARLRIINAATSTGFTVDLGELSGELIAVDGMDAVPLSGKRFPISMGQRVDIRISLPKEKAAWPVLMRREGAVEQTGIILAAAGAEIRKIPSVSQAKAPILDLALEKRLRSPAPLSDKRADVSAVYDLTGTMDPYVWGMRLRKPDGAKILAVKKGDRVHVTLNNKSAMAHPIHLHGHHFQVVAVNGKPIKGAVRDTVLVPPKQSVKIAFDADNQGKKWPLHCHHLYHMATGMMDFVEYGMA